jgi:hypothetical protein
MDKEKLAEFIAMEGPTSPLQIADLVFRLGFRKSDHIVDANKKAAQGQGMDEAELIEMFQKRICTQEKKELLFRPWLSPADGVELMAEQYNQALRFVKAICTAYKEGKLNGSRTYSQSEIDHVLEPLSTPEKFNHYAMYENILAGFQEIGRRWDALKGCKE